MNQRINETYNANLSSSEFLRTFLIKVVIKLNLAADLMTGIKNAEGSSVIVDGKKIERYIDESTYEFCNDDHVCIPVWAAIDVKATIIRDLISAIEMVMQGFAGHQEIIDAYDSLIVSIGKSILDNDDEAIRRISVNVKSQIGHLIN
jgi:hypothetical protein